MSRVRRCILAAAIVAVTCWVSAMIVAGPPTFHPSTDPWSCHTSAPDPNIVTVCYGPHGAIRRMTAPGFPPGVTPTP